MRMSLILNVQEYSYQLTPLETVMTMEGFLFDGINAVYTILEGL
jgi:hypothetical protein